MGGDSIITEYVIAYRSLFIFPRTRSFIPLAEAIRFIINHIQPSFLRMLSSRLRARLAKREKRKPLPCFSSALAIHPMGSDAYCTNAVHMHCTNSGESGMVDKSRQSHSTLPVFSLTLLLENNKTSFPLSTLRISQMYRSLPMYPNIMHSFLAASSKKKKTYYMRFFNEVYPTALHWTTRREPRSIASALAISLSSGLPKQAFPHLQLRVSVP